LLKKQRTHSPKRYVAPEEMQLMQTANRQQTYGGENLFAMLNSPTNSPMMPFVNEVQVKTEITLGPDLLSSLCRRGRRRLRDIESAYQVNVYLDKARGVIYVVGSEANVASARHHITTLEGPRKPVKAALHAELLRTRMLESGPEAALARIQEESGCRIHIERTRQEVRLFGDSDNITSAECLLTELDQQCGEEFVALKAGFNITEPQLGALALSCGVALQREEDGLVVLGLSGSVRTAVERIDEYMTNPAKLLDLPLPEEPEPNVRTKPERSNDGPQKGVSVTANMLPADGACPFCASCGAPTIFHRNSDGSMEACPFCASCGAPTIFAQQARTRVEVPRTHAKMPVDKNATNKPIPYVGQQMPLMTIDGGMVGGMVGGMAGGMAGGMNGGMASGMTGRMAVVGMVPGMAPTAFMMQPNGGMGMVPNMVSVA
jgi:hypothetical protein